MIGSEALLTSLPPAAWHVPALWLLGATVAAGLFYAFRRQSRRYEALSRTQQAQIRGSIAANLHDELGSLLMRIHLQAESMLHRRQTPDEDLERLLATTRAASSAMRDVAWGLDANADTVDALQDRMRDLLDQLALSTPVHISFTTEGLDDVAALPNRLRQETYLVFKEAITNALRHAQGATQLVARLHRHKNSLRLEVKDNGAPLAPAAARSGMGLRNMHLRAQAVGGRLEAGPRPDGPGFRICFCAPLSPPAWPRPNA